MESGAELVAPVASKMKNWSIAAGRLLGANLRIHLTFALLLFFVWVTQSGTHDAAAAWRGVSLVAVVLGSVLLHEVGHLLTAKRAGMPARTIILLPIGGVTILDDSRMPANGLATGEDGMTAWRREVRIALAGPLVSLAAAGIAAAIIHVARPDMSLTTWPFLHSAHLARSVVWANLYLVALNLLPAYPMDGGRILRALLWRKMDMIQATRRAVTIGQGLAILLMFLGVWNVWLTLIGFFLFVGGQLEESSAVFRSVLERVSMEEVMLTDFATLSPADTLEDALSKAVHTLQDDFPVIRGSDMVGVISRQRILEALRAHGNGYIQAVMHRVFEVAQRTDSLASAVRKITARGLTIIRVVENERLVGIVTLQNLRRSMALLAETRQYRRESAVE